MKIILDIIFQCQPRCGLGSQTRYMTCEDSDGNMSDKCGEKKPTTVRQREVPCFDNLEDNGGSNKWVTSVDGNYNTIYFDHGGSEKSQDFAEFLEISNSSLKNTTKWNMSDPVLAPMACNIVANDILKTA